jgi:hypothetical protein
MSSFDPVQISCPYCGEMIDIQVDMGSSEQSYVEDCSVCCRPILIHASLDEDGTPSVSATRESD